MASIRKIDLVMWTKDGAETLPTVLRRIRAVIPADAIENRILVDDGSSDETPEIAESLGWEAIPNKGRGISDGANTALKHVTSEYFASFEQDLFLAQDWWPKIPLVLSEPDVAVASGIRLSARPLALGKIQEYSLELTERKGKGSDSTAPSGRTLDNTIYKTDVIRQMGGFPKLPVPAGTDVALTMRLNSLGLKWRVDASVRSIHLRKGLREELEHYYWYGQCSNALSPLLFKKNVDVHPLFRRLLLSPLRGLQIAIAKKSPQAIYVYPLVRWAGLKGVLDSRRRKL